MSENSETGVRNGPKRVSEMDRNRCPKTSEICRISDRNTQIINSLIIPLGHCIDTPKNTQLIYQQPCHSTNVQIGQTIPKMGTNWLYFGVGCERWGKRKRATAETTTRNTMEERSWMVKLCRDNEEVIVVIGQTRD